jgi:hypothetical protein
MSAHAETPSANLPDDAAIAASLGIEDFRVGRHYLRGEERVRIGAVWLDTFWVLRVLPSFDDHGLLGVVTAHGEEFRGKTSPAWIKGFIASGASFAVQTLEADPLPPLLAHLPLLQRSNAGFLDGVGYQLRMESVELSGTLDFGNPTLPELIAIEKSCLELADRIALASGHSSLANFTTTWREYTRQRSGEGRS